MKRLLLALVAAAIAVPAVPAAAAPPELPTPKGKYGAKIKSDLLGMHVHYLSDDPINTGQKFPAVRLWDNRVRWDQINTAPGVYNWDVLDRVVANAEAVGAEQIVYVLGSTPLWAAKYPQASFPYYYGPGTASMPTNIEDWKTWVRAVATRYKGRITAYQPWNEANLQAFFYNGGADSAPAMAELTKAAQEVIAAVDPRAEFTTASSTVIQTKNFTKKSWFARYAKALRSRGIKPDSIAVHLYPWLKKGPGNGTLEQREQGLGLAKKVLKKNGYSKLPIWDTEMNYGNQRPSNPWPKVKFSQKKGAAYLAQTYLFSLTNGVSEVYWYGWDDFGLGIWPTSKSGRVLQPGEAYNTLNRWLPGAKNGGCTPFGSISTCRIKRGKKVQYIVFRDGSKKKTYRVPAKWKVRKACSVLDVCKPIRAGKVKVGLSPLLLTKK